ncbi:MAG TPA: NlpC/P60 family protein [Ignavibacteriaceae bacterium]|nr:NlpC/P60 family protein [Ignavibacteriaceae bacterium]
MLHKKIYICLAAFIIGSALLAGCASTSNTSRYKNKKEKEPPTDPSVRFTSNEKKTNNSKSSTDADTVDFDLLNQDDETLPENEQPVDISTLRSYPGGTGLEATVREKMLMEIIKYLNTPYKFGGNSKQGIDCSAFTQTIFNNVFSIQLLRSAKQQYTQGLPVNQKENLQFGDLIFFNTRRRVKPGHVGIYLGENLFAHASSSKGVIVSSLDHEYYSRTFMGGRRIENLSSSR